MQLWTCGLIYLAPFQLLGIANGPAVIQTLWGCGTSSPRDCRQTGQPLGRARVPDLGAVAFPGIHRKGPCLLSLSSPHGPSAAPPTARGMQPWGQLHVGKIPCPARRGSEVKPALNRMQRGNWVTLVSLPCLPAALCVAHKPDSEAVGAVSLPGWRKPDCFKQHLENQPAQSTSPQAVRPAQRAGVLRKSS